MDQRIYLVSKFFTIDSYVLYNYYGVKYEIKIYAKKWRCS